MGDRCPLLVCREVPGSTWIASSRADRAVWWAEIRERFERLTPPNLISWVEGPRRSTEYDEAGRRVRLLIEGVAEVPAVVPYPVGGGVR